MKNLKGPYHDFLLLSKQVPYADYKKFYNSDKIIKISDDLIEYIWDTVCWIPIIAPDNNFQSKLGLERWGTSIIEKTGAQITFNIFNSWINLFKQGPDELILRGAYTYETDPDGDYEKLIIKKESILKLFDRIKKISQKATDGSFYILHFGI